MPLPTYLVEIQFGSSSFIDVTTYVKSISIGRGINKALEDYSAGNVSVTFVNNNRVFDPLNQSSPLWYGAGGYTMVQPGGTIRITSNGIRRFTGFIQDWQFSFDQNGFDGQATVSALDEIYKISTAYFTGGTAGAVQTTSDRMNTVLKNNGFSASEYAGIQAGQTLIGFDTYTAGDSVLSYLQNVARSEPGDFYSNASAVMQFKDRSFTNYSWSNTMRSNYVAYPSTAVAVNAYYPDGSSFWALRGSAVGSATLASQFGGTVYRGGTVNAALPADQFVGFEFDDGTGSVSAIGRYGALSGKFVFSAYLRGVAGTYSGAMTVYTINNGVQTTYQDFPTVTSAASTDWVRMQGTVTVASGTPYGVQLVAGIYGSTAYTVYGEGFQIENATAVGSYFDGAYNPGTDSATSRNKVAWAGTAFASQSGYVSSTASTVTPYSVLTFADTNSQGASYGNGTGIPFTDIGIVYASENLYNKVQIVGKSASAIAEDTTGQTKYGLRVYSQTDNLTTSVTAPSQIASALLAEFRLPEYRAAEISISLESLTTAQQNLVLGLELRDPIRVCFQPSATGTIIDKYYQILGIQADADVERDKVKFILASLDNFPIKLDSPILAILDTDTLG